MTPITRELVAEVMPGASDENLTLYVDALAAAAVEHGIVNRARVAAFLATIAEETGELERVDENLNYSAQGLANTWPNRYAERDLAGEYRRGKSGYLPNAKALELHRNPEAIANHCYADRMGNGPESSGDGWRYRGSGGIQETGKDNQFAAALHFDVPLDEIGDWLRSPVGAMRSAAWGFVRRGCNTYADRGAFDSVCDVVNIGRLTKKVGDANGYAKRLAFFNRAKEALA